MEFQTFIYVLVIVIVVYYLIKDLIEHISASHQAVGEYKNRVQNLEQALETLVNSINDTNLKINDMAINQGNLIEDYRVTKKVVIAHEDFLTKGSQPNVQSENDTKYH